MILNKKDIKEFCESVWDDADEIDVIVDKEHQIILIKMSSMYDAPDLNFDRLMQLSKFMGTENINDDDRFGYGGCETCDWGSKYGYTLTVRY